LLKPLLEDLTFVGGCATGMLITDAAVPAARPTFDVDTIAEITSYAEYVSFAEKILGFTNRWYIEAMHTAELIFLEPSLRICCINAPFFLASLKHSKEGAMRISWKP
jgi:hypothetical protein